MEENEKSDSLENNKIAVALRYERGRDAAPVLSAKGKGYLAQQIVELARQNGIEVREDADLAILLEKLEVHMPIPLEAYAAVAEILAYVYKANDARKKLS